MTPDERPRLTPGFNRWGPASGTATAADPSAHNLADVAADLDRKRAAARERPPVWFGIVLAMIALLLGVALGYGAWMVWEWVG